MEDKLQAGKRGYSIGSSNNVLQMGAIKITGDVIPPIWRVVITRPNGKPHDPAINILADIVYWHRPIEIVDERGVIIEYRKRFAGDWLQRDYKSFREKFKYSRNQVKQAVDKLVEVGVIETEFRNPVIEGKKLGNVLYINLVVSKLLELTYPKDLYEQLIPLFNLNSIGVLDLNSIPLLDLNSRQIQRLLNTQTSLKDSSPPQVGAGESKISPDPEQDPEPEETPKDNKPKILNPETKTGKLGLLEIWFSEEYSLDLPARNTDAEKKGASRLWWSPLRKMLDQTDYDLETTKAFIRDCYDYLYSINNDLVVSSPKTFANTFPGIVAKRRKAGQVRIDRQFKEPPEGVEEDIKEIWADLPDEAKAYISDNPNKKDRYRQRLIALNFLPEPALAE